MAGPPEEPPTRRMAPAPPPGTPVEREVVSEGTVGPPPEAPLLEELRSVKRGLALVGVLATLALGAALWALLEAQDDDGDGRRGVSSERVSQLEDRVDELEGDVEDAASDESVSRVRRQQEDLSERVDELAEQSSGDSGAQRSVEQLEQQVQDLEQRVDDLAQQQQDDAAGDGTTPP